VRDSFSRVSAQSRAQEEGVAIAALTAEDARRDVNCTCAGRHLEGWKNPAVIAGESAEAQVDPGVVRIVLVAPLAVAPRRVGARGPGIVPNK